MRKVVPLPGSLVASMVPPALFYNAVSRRKTQARTLAEFFRGETGLEDAVAGLFIHAYARIHHLDYSA